MESYSGKAFGRIGLLGNPSDIYGGKTISFTFNNCVDVEIKDSLELRIRDGDNGEANNLDYDGKHELIKATIRRLGLEKEKMEVHYHSNIPLGSGLSGSSAIIIAFMRTLNDKFDLKMDKYKIAETALKVEIEELGISAGFQDRYAISFEGVNYFDFKGKEFMRAEDKYGVVEKLDVKGIPFFLCLGVQPKSSAIVHNPMREKFLKGSERDRQLIKSEMDRIAQLAYDGREHLLKGDWSRVGELMDENTELRDNLFPPRKKDFEMILRAKEYGALGAKVAGSGGAIVVLAEDENVMKKMQRHYPCMKPGIV